MPQVKAPKRRSHWVLTVLVLFGVLLVTAGVVAGVMYWQWLGKADERYSQMMTQSKVEIQHQRYEQALKTYQDYLKTQPSKERAYKVNIYIAQAYQMKGDNTQALAWFQKAEKLGTSWDLIVKPGIAETAQAVGQKDLSIKYYKESIELVKKTNSPDKAQTINEYTAGVTYQGGSVE